MKNSKDEFVLFSEYKSPAIFIRSLGVLAKLFLPFVLRLGLFLSYFKAHEINKIYFKGNEICIESVNGSLNELKLFQFSNPGYSWGLYFFIRFIYRVSRSLLAFPLNASLLLRNKIKSCLKKTIKTVNLIIRN